jgi:tetratricopeptide (TPR) repeat protein
MKLLSTIMAILAVSALFWSGWTQETAGTSDTIKAADSKSSAAGPNLKLLGDRYFKKGDLPKAIASYREYIDNNSDDTATGRIAQRVGDYYYRKNQFAEAAQYLSMVKGKSSIPVAFKLKLGRSLQLSGKNTEAIELLQPLAILTTLKVDVRRFIFKTLGDACLASEQNEKALYWYQRYLKLGPVKNPDVSYSIAFLQEQPDPAKARLLYQDNIKKFPADQRNYLRLGMLLSRELSTCKNAAVLLKKAINMADTVPSAWLELARVYGRLNKNDDELSAYENYRRFDTANLEAKTRIGIINLGKGSTAEAVRMLKEVYNQAPDSTTAAAALADAYIRTGKTKEALELLTKAKASNPKDTLVIRLLYQAYSKTRQDQQALDELKALLELRRDNDLLLAYGKLLLKMGKLDEAANAMEDIRATEPDNINALMLLGRILRTQKKLDEAIDIYKEVTSIDMKYAPATFERAQVYLVQGKVQWAEQFYKRALEQDPTMALALLGLARVALQCKNRDGYFDYLNKAEAMDPKNPIIKKEREKSRSMK